MPRIAVSLSGIPATITAGGPPVVFEARLTNRGTTVASGVAPVFQIVGGGCNCLQASLERRFTATGAWQAVDMPEGDGANPLLSASGPVTIGPGASVTIPYRLTVAANNPPKQAVALLDAVALTSHVKLAEASVDTDVTG